MNNEELDNQELENEEVEELLDDNFEEESEVEVPSSDYSDYEDTYEEPTESYDTSYTTFNQRQIQNQVRELRDFAKNRKNQGATDKLKNRNINTLTKNKQKENEKLEEKIDKNKQKQVQNQAKNKVQQEQATKEVAKKEVEKKATKKAAEGVATKAAAGSAAEGGLAALATNPYFWIVVGIISLIIIIVIIVIVIWAAYDGSIDESGNDNPTPDISDITYVEGYEDCTSITVTGIGTFSLDEYVAGVVTAEHGSAPTEAKKSLAVAARTYAIVNTGNCTQSIESSSRKQNFTKNYTDEAYAAATETSGQVLTYDGSIFSSEYDSWYCKGKSTCTYTREPDNSKHEVTLSSKYLSQAAGGHGRGMSQLAAADMADSGKTYKEILTYFYSDGVKISSIVETAGSTDASEAKGIPTSVDDLKSRYWFTFDIDYYASLESSSNHYFGQCVWYAKHRAMDIINSSNLSDSEKTTRINAINTVGGNGQDIVPNLSGDTFTKTNNIDSIKAPAIVSWSQGAYGHVGIIEKISKDSNGNKVYYLTDGGRKRNAGGAWYSVSKDNLWSVVNFYQEPSASKSLVQSRWSGYVFNGAASLLE